MLRPSAPETTRHLDREAARQSRPRPADRLRFGERYPDLRDRRLADTLISEDAAEEQESLSPLARITCHLHRRWAHECIGSPQHVIAVTGHRWCHRCEAEVTVAVDELTGSVTLTCRRCKQTPSTAASRQIVRNCRASLAAAGRTRTELDELPDSAA